MSLILVRWPSPLDLSQSSTCGSRRTLTATFRRTSRSRTMRANCSAVRRGMSSKLMPESSPAACSAAILRKERFSLSVHCLFLISSDVMLFSLTGGDDADDFFAMAILSIGVHHQQHNDGTELDGAECMPAL